MKTTGLHHISVMAGDPQSNLQFYTELLGQRLVKTTVNFDNPNSYHLYYADASGTPGTVLTFFPWPNARRGRIGTGEASAVAYSVPSDALDFWRNRLQVNQITTGTESSRFGERVLPFLDPDGLSLELVAVDDPPAIDHWTDGPISPDFALRGFHSTTLHLAQAEPTLELLVSEFGYQEIGREGDRIRLALNNDRNSGGIVDLLILPTLPRGVLGAGSIHHIAFRLENEQAQQTWRQHLVDLGYRVTDVADRQYFRSIYFREPGGVLFEAATDGPGFQVDEMHAELGTNLMLPPWLEPRRDEIAQSLPPITRASQDHK